MMEAANRSRKLGAWALALGVALCGAGGPVAVQAEPAGVPVRISRTPLGRIALDVTDDGVSVRKEMWATGSQVTVTAGADRITLEVSGTRLTVRSAAGEATLDSDGLGRRTGDVLALLHRSEAAVRGRALLERVDAEPNTFIGQSLLLTRVVLEAGVGSTSAFSAHRRWVASRQSDLLRPQGPALAPTKAQRVSWQKSGGDRGPGDCWDLYSIEAIRIADDFSECVDDASWYDYPGCVLVYTIRSEAAMFWFIQCSGGFPFSG